MANVTKWQLLKRLYMCSTAHVLAVRTIYIHQQSHTKMLIRHANKNSLKSQFKLTRFDLSLN